MFRFFETLIDPYAPYAQSDQPPRKLWPFLAEYIRPFRAVFAVTAGFSVLAAFADVALIWYLGRLVDLLATGGPAQVWASHATPPPRPRADSSVASERGVVRMFVFQ